MLHLKKKVPELTDCMEQKSSLENIINVQISAKNLVKIKCPHFLLVYWTNMYIFLVFRITFASSLVIPCNTFDV